ncbi:MAG: DUF3137 domain-containing protein [Oscillospiraceae bacterium]|nr:DUF3137 domain-containing protein [Oscillospiraceae bacterium]
MKIETETYGLLAKNPKKKTVQIGKEKPACPSCGTPLKSEGARCEVCGAAQGAAAGSEPVISRLSDDELGGKLQSLRRKKLLTGVIGTVLFIPAGITITIPLLWPVAIPFGIGALALWAVSMKAAKTMKHLVAVNVVRDALGEVFDVEAYETARCINSSMVGEADLIHQWNEITGNDLVQGKYKGVPIQFSDVKLVDVQEYTDSDGDTRTTRTTRFQGQWIVLEAKKPLAHMLRLRERKERKLGSGYKKTKDDVDTENEAFNEKFEILTQDPHTAFYVLTPHFMETIVAADERAAARTYLCFTGQHVHIAVDTGRDSFEAKKGSDIKNLPALRERIKGEVKYITEIADELLQNKYLFGEEN